MFVSPLSLLGAASCFDAKNPPFNFRGFPSAESCILGESLVRTKGRGSDLHPRWDILGLVTPPRTLEAEVGKTRQKTQNSVQHFPRTVRVALLEPARLLQTQPKDTDSELGLFWIRSWLQGCCILCCIPVAGTASRRPRLTFGRSVLGKTDKRKGIPASGMTDGGGVVKDHPRRQGPAF